MRPFTVFLFLLIGSGVCGRIEAKLTVSPASIDLGRQVQKQVVEREVVLTNSGDAQLEIVKVSADCGCTVPTLKDTTLAPGGSTSLKVRFDTRTYSGDLRRRIQLLTTAGTYTVDLAVRVSPWAEWEIAPLPLMLPPSMTGEPTASTFTATYHGNVPGAAITSAKTNLPWLEAQVKPSADGAQTLSLHKTPDAPAGTHSATLTLATTDPATPALTTSVLVSVISPVRAVPSPIVLPRGAPGEDVSATFRILGWDGPTPPEIQAEQGTLTYLGSSDGAHTFRLNWKVPAAGNFRWSINLKRNGRTELTVPVSHRASE